MATHTITAEDVLAIVGAVRHPQYAIPLIELGMVYGIELNGDVATITLGTNPDDVAHEPAVRDAIVAGLNDLTAAEVAFSTDPAWHPSFITEIGRSLMEHPTDHRELTDAGIRESLMLVIDPEVAINIVDLGLIYGITVSGNDVHIDMTLTTPGCPLHHTIEDSIQRTLRGRHPQIGRLDTELVWEPAWDTDMITAEGKQALGWTR